MKSYLLTLILLLSFTGFSAHAQLSYELHTCTFSESDSVYDFYDFFDEYYEQYGKTDGSRKKLISNIHSALRSLGYEWIKSTDNLANCSNDNNHGVDYESLRVNVLTRLKAM